MMNSSKRYSGPPPFTMDSYRWMVEDLLELISSSFVNYYGGDLTLYQKELLDREYSSLESKFDVFYQKLNSPRLIHVYLEILKISHEAFLNHQKDRGTGALREFYGLIAKKPIQGGRYAAEAEIRAFGELIHFKNVVVNGGDLGFVESELWGHARKIAAKLTPRVSGFSRYWGMRKDGSIHPVTPTRDARRQLKAGVNAGEFIGAAYCKLEIESGLRVTVEEAGRPSIRILLPLQNRMNIYPSFTLDLPLFF